MKAPGGAPAILEETAVSLTLPHAVRTENRSRYLSGRSTSIHVFEGLLGLLGGLKLDVGGAPGQVWVEPVHRHFY